MAGHLDAVTDVLTSAPDAALLDAAQWLSTVHLWDWEHVDDQLMLRAVALQTGGSAADQMRAIECMQACPIEAPEDTVAEVFARLVRADDGDVRRDALRAACGWAGPQRTGIIADLPIGDEHVGLRRAQLLALAAGDEPGVVMTDQAPSVDALLEMPAPLVEAWLVLAARGGEATRRLAAVQDRWTASPAPAWATILRWSRGPDAAERLGALEASGDRVARFALQARSPGRDRQSAQRVAADETEPAWRRRMAAWRWPNAPDDLVDALMQLDPVEPEGSVFAACLLADRMATPDARAELARRWIRDFDDDTKRAGAMLSALGGCNASLLHDTYESEDVGAVRLIQRLALHALGERDAGPDPVELAHAALVDSDGDFRPDVALCMLAAGTESMLPFLSSPPREPWRASTQQRAWLIERFVPDWHERIGRPLGGDVRGLRLHFDLLDARNALTHRRLIFDAASRTFVLR